MSRIQLNGRDSNIEFFKIVAVILIIISHSTPDYVSYLDTSLPAFVNVSSTTNNVQYLFLSFFKYFGQFGNAIFIICSSWFLIEDNKVKVSKIVRMILDVLGLGIICYATIALCIDNIPFSKRVLMPISSGNNWFVGCYLMLYLLHPLLNLIIDGAPKRELFTVVCIGSFLYSFLPFFYQGQFYYTALIGFIVIYFLVGYMKKYMSNIQNNKNINLIIFGGGLIILTGIILLTNILGQKYDFFSDKLIHWSAFNNILIIIPMLGLFNVVKTQKQNCNKLINYIASLSLMIYVLHDDIFFRTYLKPRIWCWIYDYYSYSHILCWVLFFAFVCFTCSFLVSSIYKETIGRVNKLFGKKVERLLDQFWEKVLNKVDQLQ